MLKEHCLWRGRGLFRRSLTVKPSMEYRVELKTKCPENDIPMNVCP